MDELKQRLVGLVGRILPYLEPWYIDHNDDYYHVKAIHPDMPDAGIWFELDRQRMYIRGNYPRNFHPYEDAPEISVSVKRSPKSIASDIHRRFLPDYLEVYAERVAYKEKWEAALRVTNALLDELGALVGEVPRHAELNRYGGLHLPYGSLTVTGHSSEPTFQFDLHSVPIELARGICLLMKLG